MTENLILWELQKILDALTKTKEEHTLNFRMIKPTEKFNFSEPILNSSKLGLIRLSVYNLVFNVNRGNNQFLYASTVIGDDKALPQALSSDTTLPITLTLSLPQAQTLHLSLIIIIKESRCYIQLLHREHMS